MKKIIVLLLATCITATVFSGCNNTSSTENTEITESVETTESTLADSTDVASEITTLQETNDNNSPEIDVWDGTVAETFAYGTGTEKDPFVILKASQLAYLAAEINSGKDYADKYVSLAADLDLNNIEWTPIGNGTHAFSGYFDGNDHTIKNMSISKGVYYNYKYPTGIAVSYCDFGLFSAVQDASVKNLVIDGAKITITNADTAFHYNVGVLCGTLRTYEGTSTVSDIDIKNATVNSDFPIKERPEIICVGGVVGFIYAYNNTTTTVSLIEIDSAISFETAYGSNNYIGTILGATDILDSTFILENCVARQKLTVSPEQYYYTFTTDFCGATGFAEASAKPFTVKNIFSKLTMNKPYLKGSENLLPAITTHAIIGEAYHYALKDDPNAIGYKFENVFGCVEQVDDKTGEKQILTDLYKLPEPSDFAQINCQGCESLPKDHGFDPDIWDVSDLFNPKLK